MIYKKVEIKVEGYQETADLYTYILDNSVEMRPNRKRPVIVICPGGGYTMTSDREAEPIAMQYLARGYHAGIFGGCPSGCKSWGILEGKIYLRSIAYRNRNSETERHDPQLSGHFLREICTYGVF